MTSAAVVSAPIEWLVLCEPNDVVALWAYQGLRRRGLDRMEVVTTSMLGHALRVQHRQTGTGARVWIELADGRVIDGSSLRGVLNRMVTPWMAHWWQHGPADASYAEAELTAFHLAWLTDLVCPVLNPPSPFGLSGRLPPPLEWAKLAAEAGLPVRATTARGGSFFHEEPIADGTQRPRASVVVVGKHVSPQLPRDWADGCRELSRLVGLPLLGILLDIDDDGGASSFGGATPVPDLSAGGSECLDALAETLRAPLARGA